MTKYIVKNQAGEIIGKRSSDRAYTHAVVAGPDRRSWMVEFKQSEIAQLKKYAASYQRVIDYLRNGGKLELINTGFSSQWFMTDLKPLKDESQSMNDRKYGKSASFEIEMPEAEVRVKTIASYLEFVKSNNARIANFEEELAKIAAGPESVGESYAVSFHGSYALAVKAMNSYNQEARSYEVVEIEVAA